MTKGPFWVINQENLTSYNEAGDGESFDARELAEKRALELAQECPGDLYVIVAPIGQAKSTISAPVLKKLDD